MRAAALLLALACSGVTAAQETFGPPDLDGCQTAQNYVWVDLEPGTTWDAKVDLSRCQQGELGLFLFYGYVASKTGASVITSRDGITLTIDEPGAAVVASTDGQLGALYLTALVPQPTRFALRAQNTGRKSQHVRLSWKRVA